MLSDESSELAEALDRIAKDEVASDIAEADLGLCQPNLDHKLKTAKAPDAD